MYCQFVLVNWKDSFKIINIRCIRLCFSINKLKSVILMLTLVFTVIDLRLEFQIKSILEMVPTDLSRWHSIDFWNYNVFFQLELYPILFLCYLKNVNKYGSCGYFFVRNH